MEEDVKAIELKSAASSYVEKATALVVTDQASLEEATRFVIRIRQTIKAIENYWNGDASNPGPVMLAHKAWKVLCDRRKAMTDLAESADKIASKKVVSFKNEQERVAAEARRKAEEKRLQEEREAKAKLDARAMKALEKGNEEKADLLLQQSESLYIPPTHVADAPKKTEVTEDGTASMIDEWEVTVENVSLLCAAVVSMKFPPSFVKVIESEIKTWAKQRNISTYAQDGIVITKTKRIATRASFNQG